MKDIQELAQAYRLFLVELGGAFKKIKEEELYKGFADSFVDAVKSPEVGFTPNEAETLIKMYDMFCLLDVGDLPSHHSMKLMVNKKVDMELLESAKVLSVSDFKERVKDNDLGTQDRTYRYEIMKRTVETGNLSKVYDEEELVDAIDQLSIRNKRITKE